MSGTVELPTVHPRNGEHVLAQAGATAGELRTPK
jgi:hypothetical protein